eukprot:CAMPEP_0171268236 /NCGR_PEP_ID=MMETSP0790-20130122/59569_1 /TAXON_ID=2925 /ORGANISM="Alexandrium catenella, Strain OF101" /LENGTH=62 /DNA_ID=CAMNT_0011736995 /DNA_START=295 /DNA_END=479 /DNA_ORIENTATION=-
MPAGRIAVEDAPQGHLAEARGTAAPAARAGVLRSGAPGCRCGGVRSPGAGLCDAAAHSAELT